MGLRSLGYRLAQACCEILPTPVALRIADRLAQWQWRHRPTTRRAVQANLSCIAGSPVAEDSPLVRAVFRNFAWYLVEFFSVHRIARLEFCVEGREHLEAARQGGRGAILLTGHLGNWELGAIGVRRMGFPVAAVALPHGDIKTDRLFNHQRQRCGIDVIPLGAHAAQRSLQRLRDGTLLGVLGDVEFSGRGIELTLCGHRAIVPQGPAILSLRSGAAVVPIFCVRDGAWSFRLCIEQPIWPTVRARAAGAVRALTCSYAAVLSRYLERFPEQWLLFQPVLGA